MGRRISKLTTVAAGAVLGLALFAGSSSAATVISSFNTNTGDLVAIAWDPLTGNLFTYSSFAETIQEFTPAGVVVDQGIPRPGNRSNDFDLDFVHSDLTVGGQTVPANSLLVINGDASPPTITAIDKNAGHPLGTVNIQNVAPVGGAHHPDRGTIYLVDWTADALIEVDANTGAEKSRFPVHRPNESPYFDVYFGDVDVHPTTGNFFVVSSSQQVIRELSPSGNYVGDIDLTQLNVPMMAGIAFDSSGDAWIAGLDGTAHKLGDLVSTKRPVECSQPGAICTGDEDDEVDGTTFDDFIYTGAGNDTISAGAGNDRIQAGAGNDRIGAGAGADHVLAGAGNDTIVGDSAAPLWARAVVGPSGDILEGGAGDDEINGEAGGDVLKGGGGADHVSGAAGADKIAGAAGNDTLLGGAGFDLLNGGSGRDTCVVDSKKERRRAKGCERFRRNF